MGRLHLNYWNETNNKLIYLKEKSNNLKEIINGHVWTKSNNEVESVIKGLNIVSLKSIEDIEADFNKAIEFCRDNNIDITEDFKKNILLDLQNEDWNGLQSKKTTLINEREQLANIETQLILKIKNNKLTFWEYLIIFFLVSFLTLSYLIFFGQDTTWQQKMNDENNFWIILCRIS